jgi:aspartate racemase
MPNFTKETLGIIGGCGVAAANELMFRIEKKLTELGCTDDAQQPEIILFQATQAPSRIAFASKKSKESFVPRFVEVGKCLKKCGATLCCIPCNTAHCAIDEIEREVGLPFINIIEETLRFIRLNFPETKKVGVLCSSGTRISELYQNTAKKIGYSFDIILPNEQFQPNVDAGIASIKGGLQYRSPEKAASYILPAANDLIDNSSEILVLGCTEIPLAIRDKYYRNIRVIDTIDVLANACIERCRIG